MSVPQPNNGVFNTTFEVFDAHECDTNIDHYFVTSEADWTPGSMFQFASEDDLTVNNDTQVVNTWENGQNDICNGGVSGRG